MASDHPSHRSIQVVSVHFPPNKPKHWVDIVPQKSDDLPVEIRGRAMWETFLDQDRNSYGVFNKYGRLACVEFVNDTAWYEIEWLKEHKEYFTKKKKKKGEFKLNPSNHKLGTWDRPYRSEIHLPILQEEAASSSKGKE
jgi:hypothetical protein